MRMTSASTALLGSAAVCALVYFVVHRASAERVSPELSSTGRANASAPSARRFDDVESLRFQELFEAGKTALEPSSKARDLAGKHVRMTGFVAEMELPPKGAFYLVPRPVHCDEAGGGTADLPSESVLVIVPSARGAEMPHRAGLLEVSGVFEVGNRPDDDGRVSGFRIVLDRPLTSPPQERKP
jgi:hypothetical protein